MNGGDSESASPNTHFSATLSLKEDNEFKVGFGRQKKELFPKTLRDAAEAERCVQALITKKATQKTLAEHANIAQHLCELKMKKNGIVKRLKLVDKETFECEWALKKAESIMSSMQLEFASYTEVSS